MMIKLLFIYGLLFIFAVTLGYYMGMIYSVPSGNVAVIQINGVISSNGASLFGEAGVNADYIIESLIEAEANPSIEGIILDINSPGGSAVPSSLIADAVANLTKPCVAYVRDSGASGAYLIASAADVVIAHNYSIIGSIGAALAPYLEFSGLMSDYNVTYINLSYPQHKDMGSEFREMTDLEYNWSMNMLVIIYESFLKQVADNRNLSVDELRPIANGSFYLGAQGVELGLIDKVGSFNDAVNEIKLLTNATSVELVRLKRETSITDLLSSLKQGSNKALAIENVIART